MTLNPKLQAIHTMRNAGVIMTRYALGENER
jgi:hypothetical protein